MGKQMSFLSSFIQRLFTEWLSFVLFFLLLECQAGKIFLGNKDKQAQSKVNSGQARQANQGKTKMRRNKPKTPGQIS
jgi:hypothetical protein